MKKVLRLKTFCNAFVLLLAVSTGLLAEEKTKDIWDGKEYYSHSSPQKDAAAALMKYIPLTGSEDVLDIGCGDGRISAALAKSLSKGSLLGIDPSPSMIEFAKKNFLKDEYRGLNFSLMSAEEIDFTDQFDLVVSFTALQWIQDHMLVIKKVKKSLKPKGLFAVTMPMGLPENLEKAVKDIVMEESWNKYFIGFDTGWNFVDKSTYEGFLQNEGFAIRRAEVVAQEDIFPSLDAFKAFISQWFPYLRPLSKSQKEKFMDRVLAKYVELEPLDSAGRLHFKINRLEVIAESQ